MGIPSNRKNLSSSKCNKNHNNPKLQPLHPAKIAERTFLLFQKVGRNILIRLLDNITTTTLPTGPRPGRDPKQRRPRKRPQFLRLLTDRTHRIRRLQKRYRKMLPVKNQTNLSPSPQRLALRRRQVIPPLGNPRLLDGACQIVKEEILLRINNHLSLLDGVYPTMNNLLLSSSSSSNPRRGNFPSNNKNLVVGDLRPGKKLLLPNSNNSKLLRQHKDGACHPENPTKVLLKRGFLLPQTCGVVLHLNSNKAHHLVVDLDLDNLG